MTVRVMEGHVLDVLRSLPANTFQCAATSPPYYGLRDYGLPPQAWGGEGEHEHEWVDATWRNSRLNDDTAGPKQRTNGGAFMGGDRRERPGAFCACGAWLGSLGLEPTPELYVEHLVSVFREVRRTLRPDGACWVNLGDSYAGSGKGPSNSLQPLASQLGAEREMSDEEHDRLLREAMDADMERADQKRRNPAQFANGQAPTAWLPVPRGCKPKDLLGMPWMVAFALRADGWYLRAEIIWSKPNPMPESVTDRPTKAHETVFLLSKQRTYFYDADAIREEAQYGYRDQPSGDARPWAHLDNRAGGRTVSGAHPEAGRNKRSVWEIATAPFPSAHFATFPPKLVEPMLLAGTSEKGCCPECGAPWERVTQPAHVEPDLSQRSTAHYNTAERYGARNGGNGGFDVLAAKMRAGEHGRQTAGWRPACAHDAAPVPCQVLDPFAGAGTTGLVADRLGRDCTLIELNPEYAQMARDRITGDSPMFTEVGA